jgi:endoglucanase
MFNLVSGRAYVRYTGLSRHSLLQMNEPHDIPDLPTWKATLQTAVNAIRSARAVSQFIILAGPEYSHPLGYATATSSVFEQLSTIIDPIAHDGHLLIFDIHVCA